MSFFKDIEPFIPALRLFNSDKLYAPKETNEKIRDFFQQYIDDKPISHTCGSCLKRIYTVIIAQYWSRPKRGAKKKL